MPCDYNEYPADWKAIRAEVMARAGNKCEGTPHFPDCRVEHMAVGQRSYKGVWYDERQINGMKSDEGMALFDHLRNPWKMTKIVLTIAHMDHDKTNNGEPGNRPNLRALCQRCHLDWDIDTHRRNGRETRERKAGLQRMF